MKNFIKALTKGCIRAPDTNTCTPKQKQK